MCRNEMARPGDSGGSNDSGGIGLIASSYPHEPGCRNAVREFASRGSGRRGERCNDGDIRRKRCWWGTQLTRPSNNSIRPRRCEPFVTGDRTREACRSSSPLVAMNSWSTEWPEVLVSVLECLQRKVIHFGATPPRMFSWEDEQILRADYAASGF